MSVAQHDLCQHIIAIDVHQDPVTDITFPLAHCHGGLWSKQELHAVAYPGCSYHTHSLGNHATHHEMQHQLLT